MRLIVQGKPRSLIGYRNKPLMVTVWALRRLKEFPVDGEYVLIDSVGYTLDPSKTAKQNEAVEPIYINLKPGEAA